MTVGKDFGQIRSNVLVHVTNIARDPWCISSVEACSWLKTYSWIGLAALRILMINVKIPSNHVSPENVPDFLTFQVTDVDHEGRMLVDTICTLWTASGLHRLVFWTRNHQMLHWSKLPTVHENNIQECSSSVKVFRMLQFITWRKMKTIGMYASRTVPLETGCNWVLWPPQQSRQISRPTIMVMLFF